MILRQLNLLLAASVVVALCAAEARAAKLLVTGTPGALVTLDGEDMGRLPLDAAIGVADGLHLLRVSHPGYRSYETAIDILAPDSEQVVEVYLLPLERRVAVVSSLFLAGTGQLYLGREKTGWTFLALQLTAVGWAVYADGEVKSLSTDYQRAAAEYQDAVTDDAIRAARQQMESTWSDLESAEDSRTMALWSIVGVAVLSAAEAWWSFGGLVEPEFEALSEPGGARLWQFGLRGGF